MIGLIIMTYAPSAVCRLDPAARRRRPGVSGGEGPVSAAERVRCPAAEGPVLAAERARCPAADDRVLAAEAADQYCLNH